MQKVAVLGMGSVGSTFAFFLSRAGHDVTGIARPGSSRLQQLQRDQAVVRAGEGGERASVRVADHLDEREAFDLVIVTVLHHQVAAVLPSLQRSAARQVQFMFNCLTPECLSAGFTTQDQPRVSYGMPFVQATMDAQGLLHATVSSWTKSLMSDPQVVALFNAAGIPSTHEPEMQLWLTCHVPLGAAILSTCSTAQGKRKGGATWAEAMAGARGLHQGFALVKRMGHRLYPSGKANLNATPAWLLASLLWTLTRSTSTRELLASGCMEARALIDAMVEQGRKVNAPTDAIEAMRPDEQLRHSSTASS